MEFNEKRAKATAIDTGVAVAGAVAGLAIDTYATNMLAKSASASKFSKHVPALLLGTIVLAQAFDVAPSSPILDSALQGAAVVMGMKAVREYTGANADEARLATSGLAHLVNQYVPAFREIGEGPTTTTTQAADAGAGSGTRYLTAAVAQANPLAGLGNLLPYRDPANAMLLAGQQAAPGPLQLGTPGGAQRPKVVG